jgi:hypothetical protein
MRVWRTGLAGLVLVAALAPEIARYRAERLLYRASAALRIVVTDPRQVPDRASALAWVTAAGRTAARSLPGDTRPLLVAGSGRLVAGDGPAALHEYRRALACGERPETDINLARVLAGLHEPDKAEQMLLRACWVGPAVFASLPAETRNAIERRARTLEAALATGRLAAPPPIPNLDAGLPPAGRPAP